jgi:hypothetical protein
MFSVPSPPWKILAVARKPAHSLVDGIRELIKGCRILKNSTCANV